jgi:hypothetical protein
MTTPNDEAERDAPSAGSGLLGMPESVRRMMEQYGHSVSGTASSVTIHCETHQEAHDLFGWLESLPHQLRELRRTGGD